MKRLLLFIILVVIGLSAFSQSPSRIISLHPAYPLVIGDTIVDNIAYSNNGLYLHDIELDSLPRYEVGDIGTQAVRYSEEGHGFYIKADSLHSQDIVYSYEVNEQPNGNIEFNEQTGKFKYYPTENDHIFVVTFTATNGTDYVLENVTFTLMPQNPTEADAFHSEGKMPDATDYITIAETTDSLTFNNGSLTFNNEQRVVYSYSISGKDVVFDDTKQNKVKFLSGREDIQELNIYAERLIIRSALKFPQTNITVYAKELIFEDQGGVVSSINTTPSPIRDLSNGSGKNGASAGNINLYIKEFKGDKAIRFILKGADGQSVNNNGTPGNGGNGGNVTSTIDLSTYCDNVRGSGGARYDTEGSIAGYGKNGKHGQFSSFTNSQAYLHPFYINAVISHANDAYINNHTEYVLQTCREYRDLIRNRLGLSLEDDENSGVNDDGPNEGIQGDINDLLINHGNFDGNESDVSSISPNKFKSGDIDQLLGDESYIDVTSELQNNLMEIDKMLFKLEQGLDYFGNPDGWAPLLSFEVLMTNYENEINRAIPTLYLYYWLSHVDQNLENQVEASQFAANQIEKELNLDIDKLNQLVLEIPHLQDEADAVANKINELIGKIQKLQKKLYAKAKHKVKKRNRLLKMFGIGKTIASAISFIPGWGTAIGTALNVGFSFASSMVSEGESAVNFNDITSALNNINGSDLSSSLNQIKSSIAENNMDNLQSAFNSIAKSAQPLINNISNLQTVLSRSSTPKSEVEKEYNKLLAKSSLWKQYNNDYAELDAKKTDLINHMNQVFSEMTTLLSDISNETRAYDAFKHDVFVGNSKRDLNAMLYLEKMEKREKDRLLKYHYYMRKAYEYRLLEPYEGEEFNLVGMYERFEKLGSLEAFMNMSDYESLSAVFWEDLSTIKDKVLDKYFENAPEQTAPLTIVIPKEQLNIIDSVGSLTLNFHDMGVFSPSEENIRIVNIKIRHLDTHIEGQVGNGGYMDLNMTHSGISQFKKDGHLYWFDHRSRTSTSPHTWGVRYDVISNAITPIEPSAATNSLLFELIGGNNDKIMLFSRPSAWSDITLTKNVHTEGGANILVDSLVLELQYDFTKRTKDYYTIDIKNNNGLLPYIACSVADINGRKNGHGSFSRLYQKSTQPINFNAVDKYETYHFVNWTKKDNSEMSRTNRLDSRGNSDQVYIANYERRVPILDIQDTIKVSNAGGTREVKVRNIGSGDIEMDWYVEHADTLRTNSWVHLQGDSIGVNNGSFTLDYDPNENGTTRIDSLEIYVPETDEMSRIIYIVQVDDPQDIILHADTLNLLASNDGTFVLRLDNKIPIRTVDFDLYLPQGITIKTDADGKLDATLNNSRSNGHSLESGKLSNGLYHFQIKSAANSLNGNSGELLSVNVTCDKNMSGGAYEGVIKNIQLYGSNNKEMTKPDTTFVVNVQAFEMGDVNHDKNVDVADVMLMVKYAMNKMPNNFHVENADINGDGHYDVSDVMGIVRISLNKNSHAPSSGILSQNEGLYLTSHEGSFILSMDNAPTYTAFQTEIILPNGCTLAGVELCRGCESSHQISYQDMGNGRYNLMVFSLGDKTFNNDGKLIHFDIVGTPTGEIKMENILFTNKECDITYFNSPQTLTNVEEIGINGDEKPYYNLEGVKTKTPKRGVYIQSGKKKTVK